MKEFWVEYEMVDTPWGVRPNRIRCFKTRKEADEFLATVSDGYVAEVELL